MRLVTEEWGGVECCGHAHAMLRVPAGTVQPCTCVNTRHRCLGTTGHAHAICCIHVHTSKCTTNHSATGRLNSHLPSMIRMLTWSGSRRRPHQSRVDSRNRHVTHEFEVIADASPSFILNTFAHELCTHTGLLVRHVCASTVTLVYQMDTKRAVNLNRFTCNQLDSACAD